jgi:hypothetical protein
MGYADIWSQHHFRRYPTELIGGSAHLITDDKSGEMKTWIFPPKCLTLFPKFDLFEHKFEMPVITGFGRLQNDCIGD